MGISFFCVCPGDIGLCSILAVTTKTSGVVHFTIAFGPTAATVFSIVSLVSIAFKLVFFFLKV